MIILTLFWEWRSLLWPMECNYLNISTVSICWVRFLYLLFILVSQIWLYLLLLLASGGNGNSPKWMKYNYYTKTKFLCKCSIWWGNCYYEKIPNLPIKSCFKSVWKAYFPGTSLVKPIAQANSRRSIPTSSRTSQSSLLAFFITAL